MYVFTKKIMLILFLFLAASMSSEAVDYLELKSLRLSREGRRISDWMAAFATVPPVQRRTATSVDNIIGLKNALLIDGEEVTMVNTITVSSISDSLQIVSRTSMTVLGGGHAISVANDVRARCLLVESSTGVYIRDIVLKGGDVDITSPTQPGEGGGLLIDQSEVHLSDATVMNNKAFYNGGGVHVKQGSTFSMVRCTLRFNEATASDGEFGGGGVFVDDDVANAVLVADTSFGDNTALTFGGGLHLRGGSLVLVACVFSTNRAPSYRGSDDLFIYAAGDTPPTLNVHSGCHADHYLSSVSETSAVTCQNCPTPFPSDLLAVTCSACNASAPVGHPSSGFSCEGNFGASCPLATMPDYLSPSCDVGSTSPQPSGHPTFSPTNWPIPPTMAPTLLCPPGTVLDDQGGASCVACPSGFYRPDLPPPWLCVACPAGQECDNTRVLGNCSVGTFSLNATSRCSNCTQGSFQAFPGRDSCHPCPAGQSAPFQGSGSCDACETGRYSTTSRGACVLWCDPGSFVHAELECVECPVGTYAPSSIKDQCVVCPAGFSTQNASKFANNTTAAATTTTTGASSCHLCPAGKAATKLSTSCEDCKAGTFSARSGSETCEACPKGTLQSLPSQSECALCGVGRFSSSLALNASECSACALGRYQPRQGSEGCEECGSGFFATIGGSGGTTSGGVVSGAGSGGATSCEACPAGSSSSSPLSWSCHLCAVGRFSPSVASAECLLCAAGSSTRVASGGTACTPCKAGKFSLGPKEGGSNSGSGTNTLASTSCTHCPAGRANPSPGAEACEACVAGYVASSAGAEACGACPGVTYSTPAASTCNACRKGFFFNPKYTRKQVTTATFVNTNGTSSSSSSSSSGNHRHCQLCPMGADCGAATSTDGQASLANLPVREGYWRASNREDKVTPCVFGSTACRGGQSVFPASTTTTEEAGRSNTRLLLSGGSAAGSSSGAGSDGYCRKGYSGPLCGRCGSGSFRNDALAKCSSCPVHVTWAPAQQDDDDGDGDESSTGSSSSRVIYQGHGGGVEPGKEARVLVGRLFASSTFFVLCVCLGGWLLLSLRHTVEGLFWCSLIRILRRHNETWAAIAVSRLLCMQDVFDEMDADGSGFVDHREFGDAMARLGFTLTVPDLTALKEQFDTDGDGLIDFQEFMAFFHQGVGAQAAAAEADVPPADETAPTAEQKVEEAKKGGGGDGEEEEEGDVGALLVSDDLMAIRRLVQDACSRGQDNVLGAFEFFDVDRTGAVTADDFRRGLLTLGVKLYPTDVALVVSKFPVTSAEAGGAVGLTQQQQLQQQQLQQQQKGQQQPLQPLIFYREFLKALHLKRKKVDKKRVALAELEFRAQMFEIADTAMFRKKPKSAFGPFGGSPSSRHESMLLGHGLRQVVGFWQLAALTATHSPLVPWPDLYRNSVNAVSVFALGLVPSLGLPCLLGDGNDGNVVGGPSDWLRLKPNGGFDWLDSFSITIILPLLVAFVLYAALTCLKPGFKRIFDFFDSDGTGSIDRQELARTIKRMTGESATAEGVDDMLSAVDTNGDGEINYEEFTEALMHIDLSKQDFTHRDQLVQRKPKDTEQLEGLLGRTETENMFALLGQGGREMQKAVKRALENKRRDLARERRRRARAKEAEYRLHPERREADKTNESFERGSAAWDRVVALVDIRIDGKRTAKHMHHFFVVTFLSLVVCTAQVVTFFQCVEVYPTSSRGRSSTVTDHDDHDAFDFAHGYTDPGDDFSLAVLAADVTIDCGGARYKAFHALAILGLILYSIGIPLLYLCLVLRYRQFVKSSDAMASDERFGKPITGHLEYLVEPYKPRYYWFAFADALHKVGVAMALACDLGNSVNSINVVDDEDKDEAAWFSSSGSKQGWHSTLLPQVVALIFTVAYSHAVCWFRPYKSRFLNSQSAVLNNCLSVLLVLALALKASTLVTASSFYSSASPTSASNSNGGVGNDDNDDGAHSDFWEIDHDKNGDDGHHDSDNKKKTTPLFHVLSFLALWSGPSFGMAFVLFRFCAHSLSSLGYVSVEYDDEEHDKRDPHHLMLALQASKAREAKVEAKEKRLMPTVGGKKAKKGINAQLFGRLFSTGRITGSTEESDEDDEEQEKNSEANSEDGRSGGGEKRKKIKHKHESKNEDDADDSSSGSEDQDKPSLPLMRKKVVGAFQKATVVPREVTQAFHQSLKTSNMAAFFSPSALSTNHQGANSALPGDEMYQTFNGMGAGGSIEMMETTNQQEGGLAGRFGRFGSVHGSFESQASIMAFPNAGDDDDDDDMIDAIMEDLVDQLLDLSHDMISDCFRFFDTDIHGAIDGRLFFKGLQVLGLETNRAQGIKVMRRLFPLRSDGKITAPEFAQSLRSLIHQSISGGNGGAELIAGGVAAPSLTNTTAALSTSETRNSNNRVEPQLPLPVAATSATTDGASNGREFGALKPKTPKSINGFGVGGMNNPKTPKRGGAAAAASLLPTTTETRRKPNMPPPRSMERFNDDEATV